MIRISSACIFIMLLLASGLARSESQEFTPEKFKSYLEILSKIKQPIDTQVLIGRFQALLAPGAETEERILNIKESGASYSIDIHDRNTGIEITFDGIKPNLATPDSSVIVANGTPLGLRHLQVRELVRLYGAWISYADEGASEGSESTVIFQSGIFKIKVYGLRTADPNDIIPYMITVSWPRPE